MFNRLFNQDNPFWQSMDRVFDLCELNILWLVCCIPIVTAGPSTVAFYYAMINLVRGEEGYVHKDFFRSFKQNFKQGLLAGLLLMAVGGFLAADVYIAYKSGKGIYTFLMFFFAFLFLIWSFVALYTMPLLAKFENSLRNTIIWAFTLSIKHFPQTLLMLFAVVVALWLCHLLPGLMFIVFGFVCQFHARRMVSILKPWLPAPASMEEDEDATEEDP